MPELISVDEALALVLQHVRPLAVEVVPLERAYGRVLAEPVPARVDLPPFPSSAMDGFAVRSTDVPGTLAVVARSAAGRPAHRALGAGEAIGIATGGVVPDGADAVVPKELVTDLGDSLEVPSHVACGDNIRPRAGDIREGAEVLPGGALLTPVGVAALAAAGVDEVRCGRRPRVAVLTTGTELRRPGETLQAGEIYESNGIMLEAVLVEVGATVERLGSVADDEGSHSAMIGRGLEADVLVSSGGVSVGQHDLVRRVGGSLGVEEVFWGVAMRPGKPLSFGVHGRTLVFGLPGNPVSSLIGCLLFAVPAVLALQGASHARPRFRSGMLGAPVPRSARRDEFVRARTVWGAAGVELHPVSGQESHMIVRAAAADAAVHVACGEGELAAGSPVRYLEL